VRGVEEDDAQFIRREREKGPNSIHRPSSACRREDRRSAKRYRLLSTKRSCHSIPPSQNSIRVVKALDVKTLTIGSGSPGTATNRRQSRKASFNRGVSYLYRKAVFDRTVVKVAEGVVAAVRVRTRRRRIAPLSGSEILLQKLLNLRFVAGTTDR